MSEEAQKEPAKKKQGGTGADYDELSSIQHQKTQQIKMGESQSY